MVTYLIFTSLTIDVWQMLEGYHLDINLLVFKGEASTLVWREWLYNSRILDIHLKHSWRRTRKRGVQGQTRLAKAMHSVNIRLADIWAINIAVVKNASFAFSTAIINSACALARKDNRRWKGLLVKIIKINGEKNTISENGNR